MAFIALFLPLLQLYGQSLTYSDVATVFQEAGEFVGLATFMLYAGPFLIILGSVMAILGSKLHVPGSIVAGVGAGAISFATMNWFIWLSGGGISTEFGAGAWMLLLGFLLVVAGIIGLAFKKY